MLARGSAPGNPSGRAQSARRTSQLAAHEAREVARVGEAQPVRDLGRGQVRIEQQPSGLQGQAGADDGAGAAPELAATQRVQVARAQADGGREVRHALVLRQIPLEQRPKPLDRPVDAGRDRGREARRVPAPELDEDLIQHGAQRVGRVLVERRDLALHRAEALQERAALHGAELQGGVAPAGSEEGELVEEARVAEGLGHELLGEEEAGSVQAADAPLAQLAGTREEEDSGPHAVGAAVEAIDAASSGHEEDVEEREGVGRGLGQERRHVPHPGRVHEQLGAVFRAVERHDTRAGRPALAAHRRKVPALRRCVHFAAPGRWLAWGEGRRSSSMVWWTAVPALGLVSALASAATAMAQEYPADAPGWELGGNAIRLETFEGRPVIAGDNGSATRKDLRIEDGTIEFDVRLTRRRSFVYLKFRMQDEREYEEIYLRPHKSGLP